MSYYNVDSLNAKLIQTYDEIIVIDKITKITCSKTYDENNCNLRKYALINKLQENLKIKKEDLYYDIARYKNIIRIVSSQK